MPKFIAVNDQTADCLLVTAETTLDAANIAEKHFLLELPLVELIRCTVLIFPVLDDAAPIATLGNPFDFELDW